MAIDLNDLVIPPEPPQKKFTFIPDKHEPLGMSTAHSVTNPPTPVLMPI